MADQLWAMVGLAGTSASLVGLAAALVRYRRQRRAAFVHHPPSRDQHLPTTIEVAEGEIALLLRRMRAYLQNRYEYTASKIADEAAFETCLARATILGAQIAELGGAAVSPAERERIRGLILEGLMVSRYTNGQTSDPQSRREGLRLAKQG